MNVIRAATVQISPAESRYLRRGVAIVTLMACLFIPQYAQTDGRQPIQSLFSQPYIFGDWGGERTKLQTKGITDDW